MQINISFGWLSNEKLIQLGKFLTSARFLVFLSIVLSIISIAYSYSHGYIASYGDSESHLNIAKRVIHALTPGFAQLGGIWLPIPHLMMVPFVYFDFLWRSGLAGSIVSGFAFVVSTYYIYKIGEYVTGKKITGTIAGLAFIANPNILYLQTTPMTELVLIMFFVISTYYFIRFIENQNDIKALIGAALATFAASLSRYDGWFLACAQLGIIGLLYLPFETLFSPKKWKPYFKSDLWQQLQGRLMLFGLIAIFGIGLWLLWDWMILGDPLYFTHSQFSAKSQQNAWLARGELPAYKNILLSFWYYTVTALSNSGVFAFILGLVGIGWFALRSGNKHRFYILLILFVPYIFNILTLYLGQSVIFIPHITPATFEWTLFNVRYGVMTIPLIAFGIGYLFMRSSWSTRTVLLVLSVVQISLFLIGYSSVISWEDGTRGLSSATAKQPDAQKWMAENYDQGLVLVDDFARTLSIIRTDIPMQNIIYVGNRPYWDESLREPEKYATWIIMQQNDEVWTNLLDNPIREGRLYKYFEKAYTSPEILIFKRNPNVPRE